MKWTLASFTLVIALSSLFAWLAPGIALQPGNLLAAHAHLHDDCLACHSLGKGVQETNCTACHALAEIGLRNADGQVLDTPRPAVQGLHQRNRRQTCVLCHAEHAGRLAGGAAARFTHERLPHDVASDCRNCHEGQQPADALHKAVRSLCGDCHETEAWSPARFDHALLGADSPACQACHQIQRPQDDLHRGLDAAVGCSACHRTRAWTPADYDHERYFRFDAAHPAHCVDCHTPGQGYRSYSCTGCHAHSSARLEAEHREEGIRDWRNCVRCHRGGGEGGEHGEHGEGGEHGEHGEGGDDD